jgi:hypothetical protein
VSAQVTSKLVAKPARALLLVPLVMLSLIGCGDDDQVDNKNSGGSGGASHAGSAGKGGASSDGGASGDAGGAALPAVVGCDGETAFEPNQQLVRSCILRAGCDPTFAPVRTISTCVTYNTQAALAGESCNLSSKTCADFEECELVGIAHDDLCGEQTDGTRCQGDLAINCGNYEGDDRFFDCAALGGTCGTLTYEDVLFADCRLDINPDSCAGLPSTDSKNYCHAGEGSEADLRYYCWDGQAFGASCSNLASCIDTPSDSSSNGGEGGTGGEAGSGNGPEVGNASCYFTTDSCSGPDSSSCNGDVATVCSSGSRFNYDCGSAGLSCSISGKNDYCLAPGCNAADVSVVCQESCSDDGARLTFCYGGAPYTVECADYGFTQCSSAINADTGRPFAACRF